MLALLPLPGAWFCPWGMSLWQDQDIPGRTVPGCLLSSPCRNSGLDTGDAPMKIVGFWLKLLKTQPSWIATEAELLTAEGTIAGASSLCSFHGQLNGTQGVVPGLLLVHTLFVASL